MNYEELVKALRCCENDLCRSCSYESGRDFRCMNRMASDAAAAIEELQAEVESMDESCKKQLVAMASHVADLQAEVERLQADVDAAYAH